MGGEHTTADPTDGPTDRDDDDRSDDANRGQDVDRSPPESAARMRRALREIRREGWKVAIVYATIDAALATLLANLLLSVARPAALPERGPLPAAVADAVGRALGFTVGEPAIAGSALVGVALGLAVFVVEVAVRVRRPLVEQFEAANPGLREALRTARDSVEDGYRSRIALRLYEDVVAELRESSSVGLIDLRRLSATVVVIALVSVVTIQVAVVGFTLDGLVGPGEDGPPDEGAPSEYGGLKDPAAVLGDPTDVPEGEENLDAVVDTGGSGSGDPGEVDSAASYDNSGFGGPETYESQRAGFAEEERLEDADLIREYNVRIREDEDA